MTSHGETYLTAFRFQMAVCLQAVCQPLCSSRKYPDPHHGGNFIYDPPTSLDFPFLQGTDGPPTPLEFPQV